MKETAYFLDKVGDKNRKANYINHNLSKYKTLFDPFNDERVVFESTPDYIYSTNALEGLSKIDPLPRILFIYRNPTERIFSEYKFHRYKTKFFKGSFSDYLGWNGETFCSEYFERGKIVSLMNKWYEVFGDNLIVFNFKDLHHPKQFITKLCRLLAIDHQFYADFDFTIKNATFGLRNRKLHLIGLKLQSFVPHWLRKTIIPIYYRFNKTSLPDKTSSEVELLEKLKEAYAEETIDKIKAKVIEV